MVCGPLWKLVLSRDANVSIGVSGRDLMAGHHLDPQWSPLRFDFSSVLWLIG